MKLAVLPDGTVDDTDMGRKVAYRLGSLHGLQVVKLTAQHGVQSELAMPGRLSLLASEYEQGRADAIQHFNEQHGY